MATVVVRAEAQAHGHTQKAIVVEAVGEEVVALIMELTGVVRLPLMVISAKETEIFGTIT